MMTKRYVAAAAMLLAGSGLVQGGNGFSIKGSNTFGEELGPALIQAFRSQHPDISIEIESKGSASGVAALLDGTCDVAATSRVINEDEQRLAKSRKIKLKNYLVGSYGVSVIVNQGNPVKSLSDHQIRDIFTGAVTNWQPLGGPDAPIEVLIRDDTGGTHLGFQELAMDRRPYTPRARAFSGYTAIADEVAAHPNAVGYVGMNLISHPGVHAVEVNGMPVNDISVNEGFYPFVRDVRLHTRAGSESPEVRKFIRFVKSREGQAIVESIGFVPLRPRMVVP
jgi:phosphate transport system substrate-binding protein